MPLPPPFPSNDARAYFRYMPSSPEAEEWGACVVNAGFTSVVPGSPYPPCKHPKDHHFTWEKGRVLPNYCFLYVTRGGGVMESTSGGCKSVSAGDLIVLHPNVWHRYRPLPETGWDEYWLEFAGDHASRVMKSARFKPEAPVLRIGYQEPILALFLEALELLRTEPPAYQLLLSALPAQVIAKILSAMKSDHHQGRPVNRVIREAKQLLASHPAQYKRLDQFAVKLNMSYSSFRRLFKAETGFSPRQFVLEVQLRRAADLLLHTDTTVSQVAEECGFESVFYFSRLFKKKMGHAPTVFRHKTS